MAGAEDDDPDDEDEVAIDIDKMSDSLAFVNSAIDAPTSASGRERGERK